jgi:hypothetical protein
VWGFAIKWPLKHAAAALFVLFVLQKNYIKKGAPAALGYQAVLATLASKEKALVMLGMFHGTPAAGRKALRSLLRLPGAKLITDVKGTYEKLNDSLLNILTHPARAQAIGLDKQAGPSA